MPMLDKSPVFTVDVGNTRTKIAVWSHAEKFCRSSLYNEKPDYETFDVSTTFEETASWLTKFFTDKNFESCLWIVSSVNSRKTETLKSVVKQIRPNDQFKTLVLSDVPIDVRYDFPEKLGLDRAVVAFAGLRLLGRGRPFLIVDVGTAATVDYVDTQGVFRGGAIIPGPKLMAESLKNRTACLPMLSDPENENLNDSSLTWNGDHVKYPATETNNAIRLGVVFSLVGAIGAFYWDVRRRIEEENEGISQDLTLLLVGGDAEATQQNIRNYFDNLDFNLKDQTTSPDIVVKPGLIHLGLLDVALSK